MIQPATGEKACEHPDKACHGESCPLARGFYDRLPQARKAALSSHMLDKAALRAIAGEYQVCPYYLSQDLVRWCDVIVGDYNHYFDHGALLYALAIANQWRTGVLIDEAHNLVERAREMYTAELDEASLGSLRRSAPPSLKKPLDRIHRCWKLFREGKKDCQAFPFLPDKFIAALQRATTAFSGYLAENPAYPSGELQRFYFDALNFCRLAESFDNKHSLVDVTRTVNAIGISSRRRREIRWSALGTSFPLLFLPSVSSMLTPPFFSRPRCIPGIFTAIPWDCRRIRPGSKYPLPSNPNSWMCGSSAISPPVTGTGNARFLPSRISYSGNMKADGEIISHSSAASIISAG
ncbi:MAG TPA: hypothetical protein VHB01_08925 [Nitrosospira sp.]|nr:hypothetical protein [Nitrosospira sp.]